MTTNIERSLATTIGEGDAVLRTHTSEIVMHHPTEALAEVEVHLPPGSTERIVPMRSKKPRAKKARDAEYLKRRLAKSRPDILADLEAKKIPSVRQAAAKAKLIKLPGRLEGMKRHWKKISKAEKDAFWTWTRMKDGASATTGSAAIVDADGYLIPEVRKFVRDWMVKTKSRPARILEAIGANRYDWTFNAAVTEPNPFRWKKELIDKLRPWLTNQGYK